MTFWAGWRQLATHTRDKNGDAWIGTVDLIISMRYSIRVSLRNPSAKIWRSTARRDKLRLSRRVINDRPYKTDPRAKTKMSVKELDFRFVNQHRGSREQFQSRYELAAKAACQGSRENHRNFCKDLVHFVSDERSLRLAAEHLRTSGGTATGPDGIALSDYPEFALWTALRQLRDQIRRGGYERGPLKRCRVPKRFGSREKRTIWVANVRDRIVARAGTQILTPLLQSVVDPLSFCWQQRGGLLALACAQHILVEEGRTHWVIEDARNAFDRVPRQRLLQILRNYVPSDDFCNLLMQLVTPPTKHGILQGSSLSMLLLDLYFTLLHRPWRNSGMPPLLRYVDDCLILLRSDEDAATAHASLASHFHNAGMQPKNGFKKAVVDLRAETAQWLGYRLRWRRGKLEVRSKYFDPEPGPDAPKTHEYLVLKFARLHERPEGWRDANAVLRGLIARLAPTLPFSDPLDIYRQIAHAAAEAGYEEIWPFSEVLTRWEADHERWLWLCDHVPDIREAIAVSSKSN